MSQQITDPDLLRLLVEHELKTNPPEPEPPKGKLSGASTGMLLGGNAADAISTIYALKGGNVREANPVYGDNPGVGKMLAIKGAGTLAQYLLLKTLAKSKPGLANNLSKVLGAGMGGVAAWNVSQSR